MDPCRGMISAGTSHDHLAAADAQVERLVEVAGLLPEDVETGHAHVGGPVLHVARHVGGPDGDEAQPVLGRVGGQLPRVLEQPLGGHAERALEQLRGLAQETSLGNGHREELGRGGTVAHAASRRMRAPSVPSFASMRSYPRSRW
jgi:hypothetical protein